MSEVYNLFPIPVSLYRLGRSFTKKELACIRECLSDLRPNDYNQTSNNNNVLELPQMNKLKKFCEESVRDFGEEVMQYDDGKPKITQSWLNLARKGEQHHRHKHPNSVWSGVFYISCGETDKILFHNDHWINGSFQFMEKSWNQYNSRTWWVPAREGELLMFPSTFVHSVPPTESDERISLSFNTFPTEDIGSDLALSLLKM